jgi:hypothetical protein
MKKALIIPAGRWMRKRREEKGDKRFKASLIYPTHEI